MIPRLSLDMYPALVFDCDGVVLNSNKVKTRAFYEAALPYGESAAQALVDYHVANGGISRYQKFGHFLESIVPIAAPQFKGPGLSALLDEYAAAVKQGLLSCEVAEGLQELRSSTPGVRWLIVSGGDQAELRDVFALRGLAPLFDGGIFGSPDTKDEILARELAEGNISTNALFIGDSRYDHIASSSAALDFVFVSQWTEFAEWRGYCEGHQLPYVHSLNDLLAAGSE